MRLFSRRRPAPAGPAFRLNPALTTAAAEAAPAVIAADLPSAETAPAPAPAAPTRYRVTYDRLGRYGRNSSPAPAPLTVVAETRWELGALIIKDARRYLASRAIDAVVDLGVMGGQVLAGDRTAGTFTLEIIPGGDVR